ncbi:MAG: hypothetical protein K6B12_03340, partial [Clostridiales bacterium]|nr:hypothetical protein [Clostridiales bacterium]
MKVKHLLIIAMICSLITPGACPWAVFADEADATDPSAPLNSEVISEEEFETPPAEVIEEPPAINSNDGTADSEEEQLAEPEEEPVSTVSSENTVVASG